MWKVILLLLFASYAVHCGKNAKKVDKNEFEDEISDAFEIEDDDTIPDVELTDEYVYLISQENQDVMKNLRSRDQISYYIALVQNLLPLK